MKKTLALLTLLLAFLPSALTAQAAKTAPVAQVKMVFADDWNEVVVTDPKGNPIVADEGVVVPIGATIKTAGSGVELQLTANKTIIRLSTKTTFKIKALKDAQNPSNDFELAAGKIRAVAAKLAGATKDPAYNINTPTANCGVRGTDFAMKYDAEAQMDWVCVQEGQVDFTNISTGARVPVAAGQFANTFDPVFAAAAVSADKLAELFSDVGFVKLDPKDVPNKEVPATTQQAKTETSEPVAAAAEQPKPAADDPIMEALKKLFGLEVGSITIQGKTYSKAILSPVVAFDGFKLGLYLPIVYTSDMFNPSDWYHPEGNDEWSFGTDQTDTWDKITDIAKDTALKIKYLELGTQGTDPFYLKLGNLKTMTIGHGTVVRNFANDQEFPSVRKIGLNAGVKLGPLTVEGMADNVASPSVVAGRLAVDLIGDQVALGVQTAADLALANDQDLVSDPVFVGKTASGYGNPMLLVGGVDLQFFKINAGGLFRITAFSDLNSMALYLPSEPSETGLAKGLDLSPAYHDGSIGSFGNETGFYGNLLMVNYRLSFQAERGLYTNGIFQGNYYRTRNTLLKSTVDYVKGVNRTSTDENLTMGVFGSFGFDIGLLSLEGAYRWPFELKSGGGIGPSDDDSLKIKVDIPKDKIPFVALSGGISYERTGFVPSLRDGVNLFDANTVFKGEVVYGLTKGLDLVVGVGTSTMRKENGDVIFNNGKPKVGPTVSIDTKVSL